jgi:UDP-N-acetylglucosamine 4,6-dehydratase
MRKKYQSSHLKFFIGDVRDKSSLYDAVNGVDYIFHAAALKQVPSCEFFPMEAVRTNIQGTENVLDLAIQLNVKKVVCLSTDKAVYPINAMGISKAMMEKVILAKSRTSNETIICITRYGNVMGSRGSVIPLFLNQIKSGNQITITDPNMTRFMMTLQEAVNLVLYAFLHGNQGDIFVQKSPGSTISLLADVISKIKGNKRKYKIIGTRHGEKHYEVLCGREEMMKAEDLGSYYRVPCDNRDLNYDLYFNQGGASLETVSEYNSSNTYQLNEKELIELLNKSGLLEN